jgi:hypothetical protein
MAYLLFCVVVQADAAAVIKNLQVEYGNTPLGIDVTQPRFSWQMATTAGERGYAQTAYQIQVKDPNGQVAWDTKRTESSTSLGIKYAGSPLKAATRYSWTVTAWNQAGARLAASSWFETGLMDPSPDSSAWGGARWIGGGDEDLVLYAPYLAIFDVKYAVTIAPVRNVHFTRRRPALAAVIAVSSGLKNRRRGPPAYVRHSPAAARPVADATAIRPASSATACRPVRR